MFMFEGLNFMEEENHARNPRVIWVLHIHCTFYKGDLAILYKRKERKRK